MRESFNPCFLGFQLSSGLRSDITGTNFNPCFLGFQPRIYSDVFLSRGDFNPCFLGFQLRYDGGIPRLSFISILVFLDFNMNPAKYVRARFERFQSLFSWISTLENHVFRVVQRFFQSLFSWISTN